MTRPDEEKVTDWSTEFDSTGMCPTGSANEQGRGARPITHNCGSR